MKKIEFGEHLKNLNTNRDHYIHELQSSFHGYATCQVLVMLLTGARCWHLNFQMPGALCKVTGKVGKWGIPEKGFQNTVHECLFQVNSPP